MLDNFQKMCYNKVTKGKRKEIKKMKTYRIIFTGNVPYDEEDIIFTKKSEAQELCDELNKEQKSAFGYRMTMKDFLAYNDHFEVKEED